MAFLTDQSNSSERLRAAYPRTTISDPGIDESRSHRPPPWWVFINPPSGGKFGVTVGYAVIAPKQSALTHRRAATVQARDRPVAGTFSGSCGAGVHSGDGGDATGKGTAKISTRDYPLRRGGASGRPPRTGRRGQFPTHCAESLSTPGESGGSSAGKHLEIRIDDIWSLEQRIEQRLIDVDHDRCVPALDGVPHQPRVALENAHRTRVATSSAQFT